MNEGKKSIYEDLEKRLNGFPVDDFVREYAKAYFEADIETIRKLQELLLRQEISIDDLSHSPDSEAPDALKGAPLKPRPHLNSGAIALPEPDKSDH
jgi:hypothetical protein